MRPLLNRHEMRSILNLLDEALAATPGTDAAWANPGWAIRMARKRLLDVAIADVEVDSVPAAGEVA
ncbi:MAG: hypothetical protein ABSC06_39505 [Rhodopila sp.]